VKTSENLGSQAEYPSHPQLLDWLAVEFMENGWDMKAMLRLLVTSATYRQSAAVTPEKLAKDPANRLLARSNRIRLPGEAVRDAALAASGLLVPTLGGPSVRPWMPDGVWDETSKYGDLRGYKPDTSAGRYRRTMYTIWKRTAGPPTMLLFDAPNRETCTVKRSRTNTPLQALALWLSPLLLKPRLWCLKQIPPLLAWLTRQMPPRWTKPRTPNTQLAKTAATVPCSKVKQATRPAAAHCLQANKWPLLDGALPTPKRVD
jgi:hypothetical protein